MYRGFMLVTPGMGHDHAIAHPQGYQETRRSPASARGRFLQVQVGSPGKELILPLVPPVALLQELPGSQGVQQGLLALGFFVGGPPQQLHSTHAQRCCFQGRLHASG